MAFSSSGASKATKDRFRSAASRGIVSDKAARAGATSNPYRISGGGVPGTGQGGGGIAKNVYGFGSPYAQAESDTLAFERQKELLKPQYLDLPPEAATGMQRLVEEYNRSFGEAKGANEERYQQLLGIADATTGQRAADVRSGYTQQSASALQGLARTGLANTTVAPTIQMGFQREQESSLNRLADEMQQTKLGIIERREDAYPSQEALYSSLGQVGQGYGGPGISAMFTALGGVRQ